MAEGSRAQRSGHAVASRMALTVTFSVPALDWGWQRSGRAAGTKPAQWHILPSHPLSSRPLRRSWAKGLLPADLDGPREGSVLHPGVSPRNWETQGPLTSLPTEGQSVGGYMGNTSWGPLRVSCREVSARSQAPSWPHPLPNSTSWPQHPHFCCDTPHLLGLTSVPARQPGLKGRKPWVSLCDTGFASSGSPLSSRSPGRVSRCRSGPRPWTVGSRPPGTASLTQPQITGSWDPQCPDSAVFLRSGAALATCHKQDPWQGQCQPQVSRIDPTEHTYLGLAMSCGLPCQARGTWPPPPARGAGPGV